MTVPGSPLDTRDMVGVHRALRRALADAPSQIAAVPPGDVAAAGRLSSYLAEVFWLLHIHHSSEDELLYPLLVERAPAAADLYGQMAEQHHEIAKSLEVAESALSRFSASGDLADGSALTAALGELASSLDVHLDAEETAVLPLASSHVTAPEWGALPGHALGSYQGERVWLPLGLVLEAMDEDVRQATLDHFPPPVLQMWRGPGSAAFSSEMGAIRLG